MSRTRPASNDASASTRDKHGSSDRAGRPPLAVVGLGCLFPGSPDVGATWATLRDGVDRITELPDTHWRPEDLFDEEKTSPDRTYGQRGGFLDPIDFRPIEFGIAPRDLEATDTAQLLGLYAAREALRDAGILDRDQKAKRRVSVLLGVTGALELVVPLGARLGHPAWWRALAASGVDRETAAEVVSKISDSMVRWQENSFPGLLGNVVAGRIANRLDLGGTNCVVDAACASSLGAVHLAAMELESGRSDAVVTGGVDTFNDIFMYTCFSKTPALSPSGHARPFDRAGDGTTLGEGIGLVVLKRYDDAVRDGDTIHAKLLGIGSSSDGKGTAIYAPSSEGQTRCLEAAYHEAGVTPDTIELIEAHGTGTAVGDAAEVRGLTTVFRKHRDAGSWCQLGSVKSQVGHTKAAAGAAGLVKAVLALRHKVLPPTIKVEHPLDELAPGTSPFVLSSQPRPWISRTGGPRRAGVSAFGFGGSNFHAVLEEAESTRTAIDFEGAPFLLAFSGSGADSLRTALDEARRAFDGADRPTARALAARLREKFDVAARQRLIVVAPFAEIALRLDRAETALAERSRIAWSLPEGILHGVGAPTGSLAFLFPGQGSQRIGMLRDLACRTPELLHALEEAEWSYWIDESDPVPLADRIYPADPFDPERARRLDAALRDTRSAQPAIGAVSIGAARLLERFGVRPAAVAGHSYGELTALHCAGRLRAEDFHQLSNFRGRLMADAGGDAAGSMAAVDLPLADLDRLVTEERLDLVVANRNAPRQGVLSGRSDEIARALSICEGRGIRATRLPVSAAFHSSSIAGAREPFREVLRKVRLSPATMPVYANTTAERYPGGEDGAKELLAGQLAQPVRFLDEIETMVGDGVRTFVEVGPGRTLTSLTDAILGERAGAEGIVAVALDGSAGRRDGMHDLALLLATVAARGHAIDLTAWDGGLEAQPMPLAKKGPSVPVSGANLRPGTTAPVTPLPAVAPPTDLVWPVRPTKPAPTPPPAPALSPVAPTVPTSPEWTLPPRAPGIDDATWRAIETLAADAQAMETEFRESQRLLFAAIEEQITHVARGNEERAGAASSTAAEPSKRPPREVKLASSMDRAPEASSAEQRNNELLPALVAIVADRTGYPADAIDPSMDLEADLGIDSIKRVEILSALRSEQPELPSPPPELLGTLRSLEEIAGWFGEQDGPAESPRAPEPEAVSVTVEPPRTTSSGSATLIPTLVAIVADRTGYPADAIDPSMDLEADLGIDSIKRVEILSALRSEQPELPSPPPELLGTLRTLDEIAGWFGEQGGSAEPPRAPNPEAVSVTVEPTVEPPRTTSSGSATLIPALVAIVADRTGYPADAIDPSMDLEADLGIDSIKRVEILSALRSEQPELPSPPPELLGTLRSLEEIAGWFGEQDGPAESPRAPELEAVSVTVEPEPPRAPEPEAVSVTLQPPRTTSSGSATLIPALVAIVADRTGYPADAIDPSMDLEADLGIDSIKRVEILSALRSEQPELPSPPPELLGTLRTLDEIAGWFDEQSGSAQSPRAPKPEAVSVTVEPVEPPRTTSSGSATLIPALVAIVADRTGYPADAIDPSMDLEADLGIDSIKRVEILSALRSEKPELPSPPPELLGTLRTLDEIAGWFGEQSGPAEPPRAPEREAVSVTVEPTVEPPRTTSSGSATLIPALVAIVADRTGYPADAIDPSMDLEADLGIDSIKRVEILSALRSEQPELPSPPPELLGTLRSLEEIAGWFANESAASADDPAATSQAATEREAPAPPRVAAAPTSAPSRVKTALAPLAGPERVLQRRVVEAIVAPRLIEGGLPLPSEGSVYVVGDPRDRLPSSLAVELRALGVPARAVSMKSPLPEERIVRLLVLVPPPEADLDALLTTFDRLQDVGASLRNAGTSGGARVVSVSRLDGAFGLREYTGADATLGSAITGITKTVPREWPGVEGRAIDVDPRIESEAATLRQLAAATLAEGPVEVGIRAEGTIVLEERDAPYAELSVESPPFEAGDCVLVTGGGRGVTAECAIALAARTHATIAILGRSPLPEPEPEWFAHITDEIALKRLLFEREGHLAPREIGERARRILSARELRQTLDRIEEVGGRAVYRAVDVRNRAALTDAVDAIRREAGPIRGWIHGAGVIEDRAIEEKTRESFARVVRTKVDGAEVLADLLTIEETRAIILFSSSTARYGRKGQVDYAVANEALNRLARRESLRRPNCRVAALGWGPWDGGMVTPGLARLFAREGVGLIGLEAGSVACVREMACAPGAPTWVTLIGPSPDGSPTGPRASSGLPVDTTPDLPFASAVETTLRENDRATTASTEPLAPSHAGERPGEPARSTPTPERRALPPRTSSSESRAPRSSAPAPRATETALRTTLDPRTMPVLADHRIDGRAVLPFALMLEWGAQAALHRHPGMQIEALERWRVMKGVIVPPDTTADLEVRVGSAAPEGDRLRVLVEIVGEGADRTILHARGEVILTAFAIAAPRPGDAPTLDADPRTPRDAYTTDLFHGPTLHTIDRILGCGAEGIAALCRPAPDPRTWLPNPHRSHWVLDPLLLDAAFQLQILWSTRNVGAPCLPCYVERLERFAGAATRESSTVRVTMTDRGEHGARTDVEIVGPDGDPRMRLHGAECVIDPSLARAFTHRNDAGRTPNDPPRNP